MLFISRVNCCSLSHNLAADKWELKKNACTSNVSIVGFITLLYQGKTMAVTVTIFYQFLSLSVLEERDKVYMTQDVN